MITSTAVPFPNNEAQQGTVATQNDKTDYAGVDPTKIKLLPLVVSSRTMTCHASETAPNRGKGHPRNLYITSKIAPTAI